MDTAVSITNLTLNLEVRLKAELDAWNNGERAWGVSNQFSRYVLESALENCTVGTVADKIKENPAMRPFEVGIMDWASLLSTFDTPDMPDFD
jgi:hypothetical protein|tara:strand:+ start:23555 stop:23830 length:276 start_codon:yes stop_codon:yes gene_type:complete